MDILKIIKGVLFSPNAFFRKASKEKGLMNAWKYFAVISVIGTALNLTTVRYQIDFMNSMMMRFGETPAQITSFAQIMGFAITGYLFGLVLIFLWAGIAHLWFKLFGANVAYDKTFQLWSYTSTPQFLLGWIPLIAWFAWIYTLVIGIIGVQHTHKLSQGRAIAAYLVPFAVFALLVLLITFTGLLLGFSRAFA